MCAGGAGKVGRARRDHSRTEQVSDLGCFAGVCLQMRNPQHDAWLHPSSVRPDGSIWPRPAGERSPPVARLNVRSWRRRGRPPIAGFTPQEQRFLRDRLQVFDRGGEVPALGIRVVRLSATRDVVSRLPAPARGLVQKGFLRVAKCGAGFCALFTLDGIVALRALLQSRPPDFELLFPGIYDALDIGASVHIEGRETGRRRIWQR